MCYCLLTTPHHNQRTFGYLISKWCFYLSVPLQKTGLTDEIIDENSEDNVVPLSKLIL